MFSQGRQAQENTIRELKQENSELRNLLVDTNRRLADLEIGQKKFETTTKQHIDYVKLSTGKLDAWSRLVDTFVKEEPTLRETVEKQLDDLTLRVKNLEQSVNSYKTETTEKLHQFDDSIVSLKLKTEMWQLEYQSKLTTVESLAHNSNNKRVQECKQMSEDIQRCKLSVNSVSRNAYKNGTDISNIKGAMDKIKVNIDVNLKQNNMIYDKQKKDQTRLEILEAAYDRFITRSENQQYRLETAAKQNEAQTRSHLLLAATCLRKMSRAIMDHPAFNTSWESIGKAMKEYVDLMRQVEPTIVKKQLASGTAEQPRVLTDKDKVDQRITLTNGCDSCSIYVYENITRRKFIGEDKSILRQASLHYIAVTRGLSLDGNNVTQALSRYIDYTQEDITQAVLERACRHTVQYLYGNPGMQVEDSFKHIKDLILNVPEIVRNDPTQDEGYINREYYDFYSKTLFLHNMSDAAYSMDTVCEMVPVIGFDVSHTQFVPQLYKDSVFVLCLFIEPPYLSMDSILAACAAWKKVRKDAEIRILYLTTDKSIPVIPQMLPKSASVYISIKKVVLPEISPAAIFTPDVHEAMKKHWKDFEKVLFN